MGLLDNIERGLERAVNTAFAKTFRSGVQPVEIAAALKKQIDVNAVIVDRDRVLAPNSFVVRLAPADAARLGKMGAALEKELRTIVLKHAKSQGYQFAGEIDVELTQDTSMSAGVIAIDSFNTEGEVEWNAALIINGSTYPLSHGITTVGRGDEADIRIKDNGASRKHLQISWNGKKAVATDLGSTNGTKANGHRFREATLTPETVLTIGQTSLQFALVPIRQRRVANLRDGNNGSFWSGA